MNEIICGDSLNVLVGFPAESVDLVVTSPPYDNLRDYEGFSFDFEGIAKELVRVLKPGGVIVWVVGDQTIKGSESGTSFRQALYFKEIGLNLHDTMIYKKRSGRPLTHNRYEQEFEYMFVLSKGKPNTVNHLKQKCVKDSGYDTFVARGKEKGNRETRKILRQEYRIKGNVWEYNTGMNSSSKEKIAFEHPAIFPLELASDHILSWSNAGDVVLDPFNGSGTTTKAAHLLERQFIGIDISEKYCEIARKRLAQGQLFTG